MPLPGLQVALRVAWLPPGSHAELTPHG